jgi:hypothetical protein
MGNLVKAKQIKTFMKIGRNDKCLCGSGLKFKNCCWDKFAVLPESSDTPELRRFKEKEAKYYTKKYRELTGDRDVS